MADQKSPTTLWGIPVVVVDTMPPDSFMLVAGDPATAFDEMAREMIARAREPHTFESCDLAGPDGPDGPWCAALCHHGPCFKPESEHHG